MIRRARTALSRMKAALVEGLEFRTRLEDIESLTRRAVIAAEAKHNSDDSEISRRLAALEAELTARLARIEAKVAGEPRAKTDPFSSFAGSADQGYGHLTYAQFGEDLMVANIFSLLGVHHPTYLDAGANHPLNGSNTALFYARGSRGVIVEANPNYMPLWRELRPGDVAVNVGIALERGEMPFHFLDGYSGRNTFSRSYAEAFIGMRPEFAVHEVRSIPTVPINDIVDEYFSGRWPDFLSLDIEGLDIPVLETARFDGSHPIVICVETKDATGVDVVEPYLDLLPQRGYRPIFRTWGNMIAVHESVAPILLCANDQRYPRLG